MSVLLMLCKMSVKTTVIAYFNDICNNIDDQNVVCKNMTFEGVCR